jgi:DNA-binding FadR family transcriptional regulator
MTSLQYMRRLHPAKARSSHDLIARTLGKEILTGTYGPGANLPHESVLMKRFRVSRTVLREVMKTLSAKGLVVLKTRVGTRVLNSSSIGDRDRFAEADLEFHQLIGIASGNPMMRSLAAVIEAALFASFSQNTPVEDAGDLRQTTATHNAVVEAIAARNGARARSAMVRVISIGQARIAKRTRGRKAEKPAARPKKKAVRR